MFHEDMRRIALFISVICVSGLLHGPLLAAGPPEEKAGDGKVHGRLSIGGLYLNFADNLSTRGEDKIDRLNESPKTSDRLMGIAILNLTYSPKSSKTEYYLGSPSTEFGRQGGGVKYRSDSGELDLYLFYSFFSEVWKDPYLVGKGREETRQDRHGAKLTWDRIQGGPYRASVTVEHQDVQDDDIASRFSALGRKGTVYELEAGRHVSFPKGFDAVPAIEYEHGTFQGDAESYDQLRAQLELKRFSPRFILHTRVWTGWTRYDEEHPVFDRRRKENAYGAFIMATKPDVFGDRNNYLLAILFYGLGDSNITFFDRKAGVVFLGIGRKF